MEHRNSAQFFLTDLAVAFCAAMLLFVTGCYEKRLAPEVEYSQQEVEVLRDEIDKMEWD